MNHALAAILNTFWQSAALAAAVWTALRLARATNAATRHAIWWTVLAVIVFLPAIPTRRSTPPAPPRVDLAPISFAPTPVGPRQPVAPAAFAAPARGPLELPAGPWTTLFFASWAAACLVQLARTAGSYVYLRRLKRDARPAAAGVCRSFDAWILACRVRRPVRLLVSARIASPMAVGFRRPAVLLPESLLAHFQHAELDHVFLHELAHMARRDDWTNLLTRLATGFLALHPVARFVLRQIDREREMACDDWAVSITGDARPYATSLTRLFELCRSRNRVLLAPGMATRASHLGERIEMLLRGRRRWVAKASLARIAFACIALIAAAIAFSETPRLLAIAQDVPPAPAVPSAPPQPAEAPEPPTPPPAPPAPPAADAPAPPAGGFLAGLVAAGYGDLSVEDIISLKNSGISPDYLVRIAGSGWGRLSPKELIDLRNAGVDPRAIGRIHALGFDFNPSDAIALHNNGVRHELFQAFHDNGWKTLSAREAIKAQQAGIDARDLSEARRYGSLNLDQIIRLKQAGVL